MELLYYKIIGSKFGNLGLVWKCRNETPKLVHIILPGPRVSAERMIGKNYPSARRGKCWKIDGVGKRITRFLNGSRVSMALTHCDLARLYPFQKSVLRLERRIPRGSVSTYGILARKLGKPNHARAVGRALAKNPFPVIIPCHRVIKSDRSLGGYAGGVRMKKKVLEMERIRFDRGGKAVVKRFWQ